MNIAHVDVLGVEISVINMAQAVDVINQWLDSSTQTYVCVTPAHSVMDCRDNPNLLKIFNSSGLTTPDGMSIVWLLWLHGFFRARRVYGPDLLLAIAQRSLATGWRHFFYGGAPGVGEDLVSHLTARFPGLQIAGSYSPPFRALTSEEDKVLVSMINAAKPDILWIGIGSPKQESWMSSHREHLEVPVMVGVGAAFDYLSGHKRQAPRWMQIVGLEWLFRWASEPRRLSRRYLRYPRFAALAMGQLLGLVRSSDGRHDQG